MGLLGVLLGGWRICWMLTSRGLCSASQNPHHQLDISDKLCPSGVCNGPSVIKYLYQLIDKGIRCILCRFLSGTKSRRMVNAPEGPEAQEISPWESSDQVWGVACSDRTKGSSFALKESRFRVDIRRKFFTLRVVKHWNKVPREIADGPIPGSVQVRVGGSSEKPCLLENISVHGTGLGTG